MYLPPLHTPRNTAPYLASNKVIACTHPDIRACAQELTRDLRDETAEILALFSFVRDRIVHSCDDGRQDLVWKAPDVLASGHGLCHAKSHLLIALLRARGIPAGICYQRIKDEESRNVLHALVAVNIESQNRWIRLDVRGGFEETAAQLIQGEEILIFPVDNDPQTWIDPVIYSSPWPELIALYQEAESVDELLQKSGNIRPCRPEQRTSSESPVNLSPC